MWIMTMFILPLLYFVPAVIAILKRKRNWLAISMLNIILGWTFLGWVVALIWSLSRDEKIVRIREK